MKQHTVKKASVWIAATGWMLLIVVGSTDLLSAARTSRLVLPFLLWLGPHISVATITAIHFALRKLGHLTEYAILAALLWCALRSTLAAIRTFVITDLVFFASLGFAAADEFHQSFVPSRTASMKDVIIDTCGAAIALALCVASRRRRRAARRWASHRKTYGFRWDNRVATAHP
jgi:VanZ family protein